MLRKFHCKPGSPNPKNVLDIVSEKTPKKFKRRGPSLTYANLKITKIIAYV